MADLTIEQQKALAMAAARLRLQQKQTAQPEQAVNAEAKAARELSGGEIASDVLSSAGRGLKNAAVGLVGLPGDMAKYAGKGVKGLAGLVGMDNGAAQMAGSIAQRSVQGALNPFGGLLPYQSAPTSQEINSAIDRVAGPAGSPRSPYGDVAQSVTEMAAGAAVPGGLVRKAASVVVPGVTSSLAGQAVEGTAAEPWARAAGAMAGGLASAGRGFNQTKQIAKSVGTDRAAVKQITDRTYDQLRSAGIKYDSNAYDQLVTKLEGDLASSGFRRAQAPKAFDALDALAEKRGTPLDFNDLDSLRKTAGAVARGIDPTEKAVASKIVEGLDEFGRYSPFITTNGASGPQIQQLMRKARDYASRNIKARTIEDALEAAKTYQSGYESGIRNQFSNLLRDKKKMRGFSPAERQAIQEAAKGGVASNLLGSFGRFGVDFSNLGNRAALGPGLAGAGTALAVDPLTGLGTVAAATGAKYAARKMTEADARRALDVVLAGGSIQKAVSGIKSSVDRRRVINFILQSLSASGQARQPMPAPNGSNR